MWQMPAQYVKPDAIAEAVTRPSMRFVAIKADDQLDLHSLHRVVSTLLDALMGMLRLDPIRSQREPHTTSNTAAAGLMAPIDGSRFARCPYAMQMASAPDGLYDHTNPSKGHSYMPIEVQPPTKVDYFVCFLPTLGVWLVKIDATFAEDR